MAAAECELHDVFLHNLRRLMAETGLTQKDLGSRLGVSKQTVNDLINGKAIPGLKIVERVSQALNVKPTELLNKKDIAATA